MKINKIEKVTFFVLLLFAVVFGASAQSDIASPYSRFGLGTVYQNKSNTALQGMGGVSNAMSGMSLINPANPASYAFIDSLTFLADAGFFIKTTSYNTSTYMERGSNASLDYANVAFGVTKWWKTGLGITPASNREYSSLVDYSLAVADGTIPYNILYEGAGGLNKASWSNGFRIFDNLSVGVAAHFLFGTINDITTVYFPDNVYLLNGRRSIKLEINDFTFDLGLLYKANIVRDYSLSIGLSYSFNSDLNAVKSAYTRNMFKGYGTNVESPIDTIYYVYDKSSKVSYPQGISAGLVLKKGERWLVGIDFNWDNWKGFQINGVNDSLQNSWNIAIGGCYTPKSNVTSGYMNRVTYRAGFHYDRTCFNFYNTSIDKYAFTFGLGLPIPRSLTSLNIAFELGQLGTIDNNLVKESFFNISIGISIYDRWFVKRKYK